MANTKTIPLFLAVAILICAVFILSSRPELLRGNLAGGNLKAQSNGLFSGTGNAEITISSFPVDPAKLGKILEIPVLPGQEARLAAIKTDGKILFELKAPDARQVLFYALGSQLEPIYLGRGTAGNGETWKYSLEAVKSGLPNGGYGVYCQVDKNGGEVFRSETVSVDINVPVLVDMSKINAVNQNIKQNILSIDADERSVESAIQSAIDSIAPMAESGREMESSIRFFAEKNRSAEQLRQSKSLKESDLEYVRGIIRQIPEDVKNFTENTLPLVMDEKIGEFKQYQSQSKRIGQEISGIAASIENDTRQAAEARTKILETVSPAKKDSIARQLDDLGQSVTLLERDICQRRGILEADSDSDGLDDGKEINNNTNPLNPDTDSDGIFDSDEITNNYDPLKPDGPSGVVCDDPRQASSISSDIYAIENISGTKNSGFQGILFEGRGLANSYINLRIYSMPVNTITKVNGYGRWSYFLDQRLADGQHAAYIASIDSRGKIRARSLAAIFAKEGDSVKLITENPDAIQDSSVQKLKFQFGLSVIAISFVALLLALFLIGAIHRNPAPKSPRI